MIPAWNFQGVIPPIRPGAQGHDPDRSPYKSPLPALVDIMGTTRARRQIIEGLLRFRSEIHQLGIMSGFQWINGSFSENVESSRGRDPQDVDVVTFLHLPEGESQTSVIAKNPRIFDNEYVQDTYRVDAY